jgi:CRP/FNR family transcriptional regulator, dissimilatory nitrate respiration regulator
MHSALTAAELDTIRRVPLLQDLPPAAVDELLKDAWVRSYPSDTLLFSAGDIAERFFIIIAGAVRLYVLNEEGDETIIEVLGAGNSFAEAAIFASGRFPVHAEALAGSRIAGVSAATMMRQFHDNTATALAVLGSLGRWHLRLMAELRQLKQRSPAQRLACYLVSLAESGAQGTTAKLPYRKNLIAGLIGITPESLSRALGRLADIGVESQGDVILIRDLQALQRFCDSG